MILIDYKDRRPIYEQIIEKFETLILKGVLKPEEQLPSVRNLAVDLSINPNTIQKAYAELERLGYIYTVKGRGSFVAEKTKLMEEKQEQVFAELKKLIQLAKDVAIAKSEWMMKNDALYEEGQI